MALVMAALILIVLSLMVPWYVIRTWTTLEYYVVGDMEWVSSRVLGLIFLWVVFLLVYFSLFMRPTRHRGVFFGWLAIATSAIAIAYFVSEVNDAVGTLGFSESPTYGPDLGFYVAIAAAVVTCVSVFVGYSTTEPNPDSLE